MRTLFKLSSLFEAGFIGVLLTLDSAIIYGNIAPVFRIFMALSGARLLSSDAYTDIANKIYAIIGVVMLFVLAYAVLRAIIDPEQSMKNELGPQMVKRIIIAVLGLALTPVIFNVLYQGQNLFLEHDVLSRIFFRGNSTLTAHMGQSSIDGVPIDESVKIDEQIKHIGGSVTAVNLWEAFFYPSEDSGKTAAEIEADPGDYFLKGYGYLAACAGVAIGAAALNIVPGIGTLASALVLGGLVFTCGSSFLNFYAGGQVNDATNGDKITLEEAYAYAAGGGSFGIFTAFLDNYVDDGEITYLFGLSTIAGAFTLYAFISFSIDMGVRSAKLAYYQIIAPIPLIMQVLPNYKQNFSQYIRSVVSTFMEVFIRISVVYIVVYIICHLTELFSSVGALWGNDDLSSVETMLALALLILGLVTFARQAPAFISESLGIKGGKMSLGIGKKLAEGGGFAAGAVVGAGVQEAVQNWRKKENQGNFTKRVLSTAAGGFSAAARSAYQQFGPGDGHKPAMNFEDARRIAGTSVEAAYQAGVNRDERTARHTKDAEAARTAYANYEAARERVRLAGGDSAPQHLKDEEDAAWKAYQAANAASRASSGLGTVVNNATRRVTAWATGTIDLSREEADIKFGAALDDMKSKTREEAYKKDAIAKQYKDEMDRLRSTVISDYREGWSEESYNEEIRRRTQQETEALRQRREDRIRIADRLAQKRTNPSSVTETEAELVRQLQVATTEEQTAESTLQSATTSAVTDLNKIAKRTEQEKTEARAKLQSQIESARRTMEAAADAWVAQNIRTNSNLQSIVQGVISANSDYILQNGSRTITTYDDAGNMINMTVAQMLEPFGASAATSAKVDFGQIQSRDVVVLDEVDAQGTVHHNTYTYTTRPDGTTGYSDGSNNPLVSAADLFARAYNSMSENNSRKITSSTAVGAVSDHGKGVKNATPLTDEYIDKVTRRRQAEENKGGRR